MAFDIKKIWELIAGTSLQDAHEIPVSEGELPGQTKKYTIAQLKQYIWTFIQLQINGITQGPQGPQGAPGSQGIQGVQGVQGLKGDKGDTGLKGDAGPTGLQGIQGPTGDKGDKGDTGLQGIQGIQGLQGDQGGPGADGSDGADGLSAYEVAVDNGFVGDEAAWLLSLKGDQGIQGLIGETGAQGIQGEQGIQGVSGADGAPGTDGADGAPGADGADGVDGDIVFQIGLACSDEVTNLTTGTAKVTFRMPYAITITNIYAGVSTAATGSAIVVDINENGATILSTKLSIDATEKTSTTAATAYVVSDTVLAADAEITIDIDQIGAVTAGKGLKVFIIGTKN